MRLARSTVWSSSHCPPYSRNVALPAEGSIQLPRSLSVSTVLAKALASFERRNVFDRWRRRDPGTRRRTEGCRQQRRASRWTPLGARLGVGQSVGVVVGDGPPTRAEIEAMWRRLIAGEVSRQEVHRWVVPWVEERWAEVSDRPSESALQELHGFDMTYDLGRPRVVRHGPGDAYFHSDKHIAERLGKWLASCARHDASDGSA
jgi:hypothetical protein